MYHGLPCQPESAQRKMGVSVAGQHQCLKEEQALFQAAGAPPTSGRIILPIIGCTRKIRKADRKTVAEYKTSKAAALSSVHLHKKLRCNIRISGTALEIASSFCYA